MSNGKGLFFDGVSYSAADMVAYLGNICSDGVVMYEDSLKPIHSGGLNIHISGGTAYLQGRGYVLEAEGCDFEVDSGTRTDLIVLALDTVNKTLELVHKEDQEEPLSNELGIAKISVIDDAITVTDIRVAASFKLQLSHNALKVAYGSYTGTGEGGATLKAEGIMPVCVFVQYGKYTMCLVRGCTGGREDNAANTSLEVDEVVWSNDSVYLNHSSAYSGVNKKGNTYQYVIIGL